MMTSSPRAPKGVVSNYFGLELTFLKIFGVSLTGDESISYRIYSFSMIFLTGILYPVLDIYELTKLNFADITDVITYLVGGITGTIKIIVLYRRREKFCALLTKLEQKPFAANPERGGDIEEKLINECRRFTTMQTLVYRGSSYTTLFLSLAYAISTRLRSSDYHDWKFNFGTFAVLNVTYSPNYEISLFYQNISYLYMGANFISVDLLVAGVLAHTAYQFKILQNFIRQLVDLSYNKMMKERKIGSTPNLPDRASGLKIASKVSWKYLKNNLTAAISYHQAVIDLVEEVEDMFSNLELSLFLTALGELCFVVYSTSKMHNNNVMIIKNVLTAICMCLQVLLVCYWGEQVVHESQQVGKAAFESNFVGTDLRYQKSLVLIMRRSQNPSQLTAGKFTVISLATFAWFLRTSYSAFALLQKTDAG